MVRVSLSWLRGVDLNHRPLGYEPNELPDCSTPRIDDNNRREVASNSRAVGRGQVRFGGRYKQQRDSTRSITHSSLAIANGCAVRNCMITASVWAAHRHLRFWKDQWPHRQLVLTECAHLCQ